MDYESLNEVSDYIEKHLEEDIDIKIISKIAGMNEFIFQRIFVFLTRMSLVEYIKKRRLSKAFEEIKSTDQKIIDIATKYRYNSVSSFNRAFKQLFGITPTECRKINAVYQLVPKVYFKKIISSELNFTYEIKDIDELELYCIHITSDDHTNLLYKIRRLYDYLKKSEYYDTFNSYGMYGIFKEHNGLYHYYVGSKNKDISLEKFIINKGKYAVFKVPSREQNEITELEDRIYRQWFPSTNYAYGMNDNFELYDKDFCYLYFSIK